MAGLAPEVGIRADVSIPDRRMAVTWSLRRSTDKAVPPSYTIETKFNLPADLNGAEIANMPSGFIGSPQLTVALLPRLISPAPNFPTSNEWPRSSSVNQAGRRGTMLMDVNV
jgi:hypothetical protein